MKEEEREMIISVNKMFKKFNRDSSGFMDIKDAYHFMKLASIDYFQDGGDIACFDLFKKWDLDQIGLIDKHDALLIIRQVMGHKTKPKIYFNKYF